MKPEALTTGPHARRIRSARPEIPRATVTTARTYSLSVLIGNGNFLGTHPSAMLTTPNEHPQLTAVDVRLPTTHGAIGLISLKDRSLSPVAKLFAQSVAPVLQEIRPKRTSRATRK